MSRTRSGRGSVVLLSGGVDSATCLAIASRSSPPVHALTVGYGQRHLRELRAARAVARRFGVARHLVLDLPLAPLLDSALTRPHRRLPASEPRPGTIPSTYVPARNTILLALALGYAESHRLGSIYLGANAVDYSGYPDCRGPYLRSFERTARLATKAGVLGRRTIRIRAPLLRLSKAEIVQLGTRLGVPWAQTWSCYAGGRVPCGRCASCRIRSRGFRDAGIRDPATPRGS